MNSVFPLRRGLTALFLVLALLCAIPALAAEDGASTGTESSGSADTGGTDSSGTAAAGTDSDGTDTSGDTGTDSSGTDTTGDTGTDSSGTDTTGGTGTDSDGTDTTGDTGTDSSGTDTSGGTGTDSSGTGSEVTSGYVFLSESILSMQVGNTSSLRGTASPAGAAIRWRVSGEGVVELSNSIGSTISLRAVGPGHVTVSAQVGSGPEDTCDVTVSGIVFSQPTLNLSVNNTATLQIHAYGGAAQVATWDVSSSNTNVARAIRTSTGGVQVNALGVGTAQITCNGGGYTARCQVTVTESEAVTIKGKLVNGVLRFSTLVTDIRNQCRELTGGTLSYVSNLSVPTNQGTLYDGYSSENNTGHGVAGNRQYYSGSGAYQLENVSFVPKAGVSGTVTITYTGTSTDNKSFTGVITVEVAEIETTLAYASRDGEAIHFRAEDFSSYSQRVTNRSLQYVTFTLPSTSYGALYYNYTSPTVHGGLVASSTRYYRTTNPALSNVAFVPAPGYQGSFALSFTGCDTEGKTFQGKVRIDVGATGAVGIQIRPGERYSLSTSLFDPGDDRTINYIVFTSLPSSSWGTLYDSSDDVETGTRYYRSSSSSRQRISSLRFQAGNQLGTVSLDYRGVDTEGDEFTGTLTFTITSDGDSDAAIQLEPRERYSFRTSLFDAGDDRSINYISFTSLPGAAWGTLYDSSDEVETGTRYYRTASGSRRRITDLYFQAGSRTGTVSFRYLGVDTEGDEFTGTLTFTISDSANSTSTPNGTSPGALTYTTTGPAVALRSADIIARAAETIQNVEVVRVSMGGATVTSTVNGVQRTSPVANAGENVGRLLMNYVAPGRYSAFTPGQDYPIEAADQIFFLPKAGFQGAVTLLYQARDRVGNVYGNIITIQVTPPTSSRYFTDLAGRDWAVPAVDFFRNYQVLQGVTATTYEPDGPARRGQFLTVLGRMFFPPGDPTQSGFWDVSPNLYYAEYLSSARALGIVDPWDYFYPDAPITRQDAAMYLYRCLVRAGRAPQGTIDDLTRFTDWTSVSSYARASMASMVRLGVFQGDEAGRLNPSGRLTRLQMAAILYRAVT